MKDETPDHELQALASLAAALHKAHRLESVGRSLDAWLKAELQGCAVSLVLNGIQGKTVDHQGWQASAPSAPPGAPRVQLTIPVLGEGRPVGRLECLLPQASADAISTAPLLLEAAGNIIGLACAQARVVRKVTKLSRSAIRDNAKLKDDLRAAGASQDFVARSSAMQAVVRLAELVAPHPTTVLLRGESGTGKEVVARHIHKLSGRRGEPFVAVNCAAIPDALVESDLFGHELGSFTGATRQHKGRFERADGGTLMLDEVAELPVAIQAKLLRVLQEGTIERVGGASSVPVDVRVIAATHQPLEELMETGAFRSDLFYRLSAFPIEIPPLRERPEDILALAERQLQASAAQIGEPPIPFTSQQNRALLRAPWPGNVRQLMNEVERAVILGDGGRPRLSMGPSITSQGETTEPSPPPKTLNESITDAIAAALRATGGRIYGQGGAAERLGLKPSTLQAKMIKLGLRRSDFSK